MKTLNSVIQGKKKIIKVKPCGRKKNEDTAMNGTKRQERKVKPYKYEKRKNEDTVREGRERGSLMIDR